MAEISKVPIRVMGAPIQTQMFDAFGMAPTVIAYSEVYNAIQTGVIDAAENEAAGIEQMKFYEVGPNISLTAHAITVRPLCFSGKTLRRLARGPAGGHPSGRQGRRHLRPRHRDHRGRREDGEMEKEGKLKTITLHRARQADRGGTAGARGVLQEARRRRSLQRHPGGQVIGVRPHRMRFASHGTAAPGLPSVLAHAPMRHPWTESSA